MLVAKAFAAAAVVCVAGTAMAQGFDRKTMIELLPCKSAALRLCDRSHGIDAEALWRCAARLAERQHEVSERCVSVLRRHGQL